MLLSSEEVGVQFTLEVTDRPGGTNTSHTIAVDLLTSLLNAVPAGAPKDEYRRVAVDENVLGKATVAGRNRAFRYLRELYLLDPSALLFRALRDLWDEDPGSRPLLAGLMSYARDSSFRASSAAVLPLIAGDTVSSQDLAAAVVATYPDAYSPLTANKIGRNTGSSWTQTGHLTGRAKKTRIQVEARPASAALALLLGHLEGVRGQALFATRWIAFLDSEVHHVESLAAQANARGYLELRSSGTVVEISFQHLLRPMKDA